MADELASYAWLAAALIGRAFAAAGYGVWLLVAVLVGAKEIELVRRWRDERNEEVVGEVGSAAELRREHSHDRTACAGVRNRHRRRHAAVGSDPEHPAERFAGDRRAHSYDGSDHWHRNFLGCE